MSSPPRTPREEEQRLNLRTLVIASAASATAALVTSRLWIAGTWIAAAMTPVLVTVVSELLRRPTERIVRGITVDRPALPDPEAPAAARRVAERLRGDDHALPDPDAPPPSSAPGRTRVYRSGSSRSAPRRRRIAYNVVFGTAALAFVIGVLALTVPELIAGSSVGTTGARRSSADRRRRAPATATTRRPSSPPPTRPRPISSQPLRPTRPRRPRPRPRPPR